MRFQLALVASSARGHAVFDDAVQLQRYRPLGVLEEETTPPTALLHESITSLQASPVSVPLPDFSGHVPMEREFVTSFPEEIYAKIPWAENGVQFFEQAVPSDVGAECAACDAAPFGENHVCSCLDMVSFPLNHHFQNVIGAKKVDGREEIGDLQWIGMDNSDGSVFPGAVMAFAERFHVRKMTGVQPHQAEVPPVPSAEQETIAKIFAPLRTSEVLTFMGASRIIPTWSKSGQDPAYLHALSTYVSLNPHVNATVGNQYEQYINAAQVELDSLPDAEPVSVSTSCLHFIQQATHDHHPLVKIENDIVTFPLNMNLIAARGQTMFTPGYQVSVTVGTGSWRKVGDDLVFHTGTSSVGLYDIDRRDFGSAAALAGKTPSSTFRENPKLRICMECLDGGNFNVTIPRTTHVMRAKDFVQAFDQRRTIHEDVNHFNTMKDVDGYMSQFHQMFIQYAQRDMSHTYLYQKQADACSKTEPPEMPYYYQMAAWSSSLDFINWFNDETKDFTAQESQLFGQHFIATLPCGSSFLRAPEDHSNGADLLEVALYSHFTMEWPAAHRMDAVYGSMVDELNWHHKAMPSTR